MLTSRKQGSLAWETISFGSTLRGTPLVALWQTSSRQLGLCSKAGDLICLTLLAKVMTARGIWAEKRGGGANLDHRENTTCCVGLCTLQESLPELGHCSCLQASRCTKHVKHAQWRSWSALLGRRPSGWNVTCPALRTSGDWRSSVKPAGFSMTSVWPVFWTNTTRFSAHLIFIQQGRDPKARLMAGSLSKALDSFAFSICAVICSKLLQYLTPLSNYLQAPAVDLMKASSEAPQLVSFLKTSTTTPSGISRWRS